MSNFRLANFRVNWNLCAAACGLLLWLLQMRLAQTLFAHLPTLHFTEPTILQIFLDVSLLWSWIASDVPTFIIMYFHKRFKFYACAHTSYVQSVSQLLNCLYTKEKNGPEFSYLILISHSTKRILNHYTSHYIEWCTHNTSTTRMQFMRIIISNACTKNISS